MMSKETNMSRWIPQAYRSPYAAVGSCTVHILPGLPLQAVAENQDQLAKMRTSTVVP